MAGRMGIATLLALVVLLGCLSFTAQARPRRFSSLSTASLRKIFTRDEGADPCEALFEENDGLFPGAAEKP